MGPDPDATGQNSIDPWPVLHPDQKPKSPFSTFHSCIYFIV